MVKLTEVEDEHFREKPISSKNDVLLASEEDEDFTDTGICNSFLSPLHFARLSGLVALFHQVEIMSCQVDILSSQDTEHTHPFATLPSARIYMQAVSKTNPALSSLNSQILKFPRTPMRP